MFSPIVNYTSTHSMSVGVYYIFLHFGRLWTFILWIVQNPACFQLHLIKGEDEGLGEEKEKMILVASQDKVGGLKIGRKLKITPFTNGPPPPPPSKFVSHSRNYYVAYLLEESHFCLCFYDHFNFVIMSAIFRCIPLIGRNLYPTLIAPALTWV